MAARQLRYVYASPSTIARTTASARSVSRNAGGSAVANVKHAFANDVGYVKLTAKVQDERNGFYVPSAEKREQSADDSRGIDIRHGSIYSADLRRGVSLPSTPDGALNPDLVDGGTRSSATSHGLDLKLGDNFKTERPQRYTKVNWNSPSSSSRRRHFRFRRSRTPSAASPARSSPPRNPAPTTSIVSRFPAAAGVSIADPTPLNGNVSAFSRVKHRRCEHQHVSKRPAPHRQREDRHRRDRGIFTAMAKIQAYAHANTMVTEIHNLPRRLDFEYLDATTAAPRLRHL